MSTDLDPREIDPYGDRVAFLQGLLSCLGKDATVVKAIEDGRDRKRDELQDRIEAEERAKYRAGVEMGGLGDE